MTQWHTAAFYVPLVFALLCVGCGLLTGAAIFWLFAVICAAVAVAAPLTRTR